MRRTCERCCLQGAEAAIAERSTAANTLQTPSSKTWKSLLSVVTPNQQHGRAPSHTAQNARPATLLQTSAPMQLKPSATCMDTSMAKVHSATCAHTWSNISLPKSIPGVANMQPCGLASHTTGKVHLYTVPMAHSNVSLCAFVSCRVAAGLHLQAANKSAMLAVLHTNIAHHHTSTNPSASDSKRNISNSEWYTGSVHSSRGGKSCAKMA
mmetsp:Transcript_29864/g.68831  ORF Transcript_29864/g.68831 Transcript_29864/m.68831 type:complete len:210 (-) Transcript_29864:2-631(-)